MTISNNNTPIYQQLADKISDDIVEKKLQSDERVPSVREIAAEYEVNANTAMKAIDLLSSNGIIYNKRGMGYFVSNQADEIIRTNKKKEFIENDLPKVIKTMHQLGISIKEVEKEFNNYKN